MTLAINKDEWRLVRLDEVVTRREENDRENAQSRFDSFVKVEHMEAGSLHLKSVGSQKDEELPPTFYKIFRKGQILFPTRNPHLRRSAVAPCDGICGEKTLTLEVNDEVADPCLIPFLFHSAGFYDHTAGAIIGSTNPHCRWRDVANFEFRLPPRDQQVKLSELLWAADAAKVATSSVPIALSNLQRAQFESAMSKDPKRVIALGEVLEDIVAGKSPNALGRPARKNEFGVLKVSAVGKNRYEESENKALISSADFASACEVKSGFVLVTRANALPSGVGRPCYVSETRSGLMLSDKTLRLVPKRGGMPERLLYQNLLTKKYRSYIESAIGGTEAKNISQARIKKAPIWNPQDAVRERTLVLLHLQDEAIATATQCREHSVHLLKSLINEIF